MLAALSAFLPGAGAAGGAAGAAGGLSSILGSVMPMAQNFLGVANQTATTVQQTRQTVQRLRSLVPPSRRSRTAANRDQLIQSVLTRALQSPPVAAPVARRPASTPVRRVRVITPAQAPSVLPPVQPEPMPAQMQYSNQQPAPAAPAADTIGGLPKAVVYGGAAVLGLGFIYAITRKS